MVAEVQTANGSASAHGDEGSLVGACRAFGGGAAGVAAPVGREVGEVATWTRSLVVDL